MALKFGESRGGAQSNKVDNYEYKNGENRIRIVGDLLARYVYWLKGENNKSIPFENLAFDRVSERFTNAEKDWVKTFYPDQKSSWAYAIQCIDLDNKKLVVLNLKKKLMTQIQDLAKDIELDPTDPVAGFDIIFEKKSTGPLPINVEYTVKQLKCKPRALNEAEMELIKDLKSMDEVMPRPTPEAQKELLDKISSGGSSSDKEGIEEEVSEEFEVK